MPSVRPIKLTKIIIKLLDSDNITKLHTENKNIIIIFINWLLFILLKDMKIKMFKAINKTTHISITCWASRLNRKLEKVPVDLKL